VNFLVYLLPFIFLIFGIFTIFNSKYIFKSYKYLLFFLLLPALLVVLLSGDTGTDKASYYVWIAYTFNGNADKILYEPGFKLLTYLLSLIYPHEYFIVPVIGFLTTLFLVLAFSGSKWQLIIFAFLLFPFFYFDMTMNGLRYGLSFAISAYAAKQIVQGNIKMFLLFGLLAVSMQYSSLIIIILVFLTQVKIKKIFLFMLIILSFALLNFFDLSYFSSKVDAYKDLVRPSGISGLSPLLIFSLFFLLNKCLHKKIDFIFYIIFLLEILSFILSLSSYSGLRFQNLCIFVLLIFMAFFQKTRPFKKKYIVFFLILGVLCFSLKIRNFLTEEEGVTTPFLPYKFYWER